ncbi:MAG: hypothetical protein QG574_4074, partial [Cyanobacteriota bacterium erpe_2018_sw_21hr_WHONDRS-SW48-000092_B_bin.40]|nr:hypothetical protein [Cyanobacteriota bacterium erpe_2018_sw_21hr_WHONDRS-SW48-000092_B_bin.40]
WGAETRHGVIDIDIDSRYHNAQELTKLVYKFASVGLILTPYQSSNSGGWHLYYFLDDWAPSSEIEQTIKEWLKALGYVLQSGTLEVFPSGNALRLPLQQGFAWLAPDGQVTTRREDLKQDEALALFLSNLKSTARNWQNAKTLILAEIERTRTAAGTSAQDELDQLSDEGFEGLFRGGLDWEKYQRGRQYWISGLTGPSQRHDAVICIGHYLWYGDRGAGLRPLPYPRNAKAREDKIAAWLESNHNGQSRAVNSGAWRDVAREIERATKWTSQGALIKEKYEPYPLTERLLKRLEWLYQKTGKLWTIEELQKANVDRSIDARHRIAVAMAQLEAEGAQITQAAVAIRAGACRKTVRRHSDLFAAWGGVYNGGAGGRLSPLVLLSTSGENGLDHSVPADKETKADQPVFVWGLTENKSCPSGSESVVRRPVSSELGGLGPKDLPEHEQIAAFAASESAGLAGSVSGKEKAESPITRYLSLVQALPEPTENKKPTSKNSLQPVSVLVGAGCRGP